MKRFWIMIGLCVYLMIATVGCIIDSGSDSDSDVELPETDYNAISQSRAMGASTASESVARNPECFAGLKIIAEETALEGALSGDGTETAKERMKAYAVAYESVARQPEAKSEIWEITELAVGRTNQRDPFLREEEVEIVRLHSFCVLYDSIARQPEASEDLVATALRFAGGPKATLTDDEARARLESFGALFEAIARNPEATEKLIAAAETLTGRVDYLSKKLSDPERCGRQFALKGFYEAYARQPEAERDYEQASRVLLGFEIDLPDSVVD